MKFLVTRLPLCLALIIFACTSINAHAVNISEYRIYLDKENRTKSFLIYNKDVQPQDCNLKLRHFNFDAASKISKHTGDELPENSAKDWIRFSPKIFTLTPAQSQTVRFTLRRKANAEAAEYRSYLQIDCGVATPKDPISKTEKSSISIKPKLMHNVPIIARNGKLNASVDIRDIKLADSELHFKLTRSGNRSVYGKIELINRETNEVISFQDSFSIYTESDYFDFDLPTNGIPPSNILIRFTENTNYGGSIIFEKPARL